MTANDVRIGNWVKDRNFTYPSQITAYAILSMEHGYEGYTGIALTPEIFEACGFTLCVLPKNWLNGANGYEIAIQESAGRFLMIAGHRGPFATVYEKDEGIYRGSSISNQITYLHSLQNLYFSMTGKELKIDSKIISK